MYKNKILLFTISLAVLSSAAPFGDDAHISDQELKAALALQDQKAAAEAQYHFASNVQDGISDLTQAREEVRDGLNVKGYYSYSDGHFKRKVSYEADEKGYRIVGEEVLPLNGPHVNPDGKASIHTRAHGNELKYSIVGDDTTRHRRLLEKMEQEKLIRPTF